MCDGMITIEFKSLLTGKTLLNHKPHNYAFGAHRYCNFQGGGILCVRQRRVQVTLSWRNLEKCYSKLIIYPKYYYAMKKGKKYKNIVF